MKQLTLLGLALLLGFAAPVHADDDIRITTRDGKTVLLKSDYTWELLDIEEGDPSTSAVMTVMKVNEMQDACKIQFRLQNNLGYKIKALVPKIAIYLEDGIEYDRYSISFTNIWPTEAKYTEQQFSGKGCHEIAYFRVYDAARCKMGQLDLWNAEEGECLSKLIVEPSELINISK